MKNVLVKNRLIFLGALLGGLAGYLYYRFVGCTSGTCLISSKPLNSTLYFAVLGAVFLSMFKKKTDGNAKRS